MDLEIWFAFILATVVVTLLPGPSMLLVIGHTLISGTRKSVATITGVVLADGILLGLSLFGIGTVLYSSAVAFMIMKWIGALYLFYLGIRQWRAASKISLINQNTSTLSTQEMFFHGFVTTLLNPKIIGFFIAFFPQFILPNKPLVMQLAILGSTFLLVVFLIMGLYSLLAEQARNLVTQSNALQIMNKISGGMLMGAGLVTATLKRT